MISLTTIVPVWCVRTVLLHRFLLRPVSRSLSFYAPFWTEYVQLGLCLLLAVSVVFTMSRFGLGRSEFWWLAGGLFVLTTAATSLIMDIPDSGFVYLDLLFSMVSGYWLIIFFVGALAWRHWMPTPPPRSSTSAPVVDYDDW